MGDRERIGSGRHLRMRGNGIARLTEELSIPRHDDGGHLAVVGVNEEAVVEACRRASERVLVCSVTAEKKLYRAGSAILEAFGMSAKGDQIYFDTGRVLKEFGDGIVVLKDADNLWSGLRGRGLMAAQNEIKSYGNTTQVRFVLVGGGQMWDGIASNAQLNWRYGYRPIVVAEE